MPASQKKITVNKFPLRLMPSVRKVAEQISQREGVSLNPFINVAVAEKLAHLQHEEWLARRAKVTDSSIAKALLILDRPTGHRPGANDELPKGYVSVRRASVRIPRANPVTKRGQVKRSRLRRTA